MYLYPLEYRLGEDKWIEYFVGGETTEIITESIYVLNFRLFELDECYSYPSKISRIKITNKDDVILKVLLTNHEFTLKNNGYSLQYSDDILIYGSFSTNHKILSKICGPDIKNVIKKDKHYDIYER